MSTCNGTLVETNMLWIDQLPANAAVGVRLTPSWRTSAEVIAMLQPLLATWHQKGGFNLAQEGAFNLTATVPKMGLTLRIEPEAAWCKFSHFSMVSQPVRQQAELVGSSLAIQWSQARDLAKGTLFDAMRLLASSQQVLRCGFVAETGFAAGAAVPGVQQIFEQSQGPWKNAPKELHLRAVVDLAEEPTMDRCVHDLVRQANGEIAVVLDWQRAFPADAALPLKRFVSKELERCQTAAVAYFQQVGTGDFTR